MLTPDRPPPKDYYQNNCRTLLGFVLDRYAHLLQAHQVHTLQAYLALSDDGQRLFARILTRKGPCIRLDTLDYAEVSDLAGGLKSLSIAKLISINPHGPADVVLNLMRKPELLSLIGNPAGLRTMRKAELIEGFLSGRSDQQVLRAVSGSQSWLRVTDEYLWWLVRLLYFGDAQQDWSSFVIRDLGLIEYEAIELSAVLFCDQAMLAEDLHHRYLSEMCSRLDECPALVAELHQRLLVIPSQRYANARRERTLLRLGKWCERANDKNAALSIYANVTKHPARERVIRILHKQGRYLECHIALQQLRQSPAVEEEILFADRFGQRNGGFQPEVWELEIDQASHNIESQALDILYELGEIQCGYHVENSLIRTLTGLLYWPAIFADVPGAFTNPFQAAPNDLYFPDFATTRAMVIANIEESTSNDQSFVEHVQSVATAKLGKANVLVDWPMLDEISLEQILYLVPAAHLRALCGFLIRNLNSRRAGFPDLLVGYVDGGYELIEVKGPNDQLQPGQRIWFSYFARFGIPARVLKLKLAKAAV